eukprot:COSAG06_NODE_30735_length_533_cov_0.963134_1_plen_121_part_10
MGIFLARAWQCLLDGQRGTPTEASQQPAASSQQPAASSWQPAAAASAGQARCPQPVSGMQLTVALLLLGTASLAAGAAPYFRISVVDSQTGRGVPLVLLRTGDFVQQYSDSAGNIAFYEPG